MAYVNGRFVRHVPSIDNPSQEYNLALMDSKKIHWGKTCNGRFLRPHDPYIKQTVERLGIESILDYGCGKGQQYEWINPHTGKTMEQNWGIEVAKYDPAYPKFDKMPRGRFDLVLCTHTLNFVPTTDHAWVVDKLYGLARKCLYVAERLHRPRKVAGRADTRSGSLGWGVDEWKKVLERPGTGIEVILCTRVKTAENQKIQNMTVWNGEVWSPSKQMISGGGFKDVA